MLEASDSGTPRRQQHLTQPRGEGTSPGIFSAFGKLLIMV